MTAEGPPGFSPREADALAGDLLERLEAIEPLSPLLLRARRFAEIVGDAEAVEWLKLETGGLAVAKRGGTRTAAELSALRLFMRLHAIEDLDNVDLSDLSRPMERREVPERRMIAYQSVPQLEATTQPGELTGESRYDRRLAEAWGRNMLFFGEAQRMLSNIRAELHTYVSRSRNSLRERYGTGATAGPDASAVQRATGAIERSTPRTIFVAYPWSVQDRDAYKAAYLRLEGPLSARFVFAESEIGDRHVLDKIEQMIRETAFGFYDITGWNANVALEYGIARGVGRTKIIVNNPTMSDLREVPADIRGIDRINYTSLEELSLGAQQVTLKVLGLQSLPIVTLRGTVHAPDGKPLPATPVFSGLEPNQLATWTSTGSTGEFVFQVPRGLLVPITAIADGYQSTRVLVDSNRDETVDIVAQSL
jgi:hypothetical protein